MSNGFRHGMHSDMEVRFLVLEVSCSHYFVLAILNLDSSCFTGEVTSVCLVSSCHGLSLYSLKYLIQKDSFSGDIEQASLSVSSTGNRTLTSLPKLRKDFKSRRLLNSLITFDELSNVRPKGKFIASRLLYYAQSRRHRCLISHLSVKGLVSPMMTTKRVRIKRWEPNPDLHPTLSTSICPLGSGA